MPTLLRRDLHLRHALSANLLGMIGIGPFLTVSTMVERMGETHVMYAWLAGAALAICDGLVYAQLGAALPRAGGAYVYLKEAYRPLKLSRYVSFLFLVQILFVAPLSLAGGAVGFADYLGFVWSPMSTAQHHTVAALLCVVVTALLYRRTKSVGWLSMVMMSVVIATLVAVMLGGVWHALSPDWAAPGSASPGSATHATTPDGLPSGLWSSLGPAALLAMYNYGGYNTACNLGDELHDAHRTLPRSILLSIAVAVALNIGVSAAFVSVIPHAELVTTKAAASLFAHKLFADPSARTMASTVMTLAVLFIAATSLYALLLGYSRIPFAAARDGHFFRAFGKLHPKGDFPHVSLLVLGLAATPFCFFSIVTLIEYLMLVQIVMQFLWLGAGVLVLHRYRRDIPQPFRMPLFPLPAIIAFAMWSFVFITAPTSGQLVALLFFVTGSVLYAVYRRTERPSEPA